MSLDSPALSNALISWASDHLSPTNHDYRITALEARSTALTHLAHTLPMGSATNIHTQQANAATCLILLTSEVCLANYSGWYAHLLGARSIILSAQLHSASHSLIGPDALKTTAEGRWILRNFAYHDVLGSVPLLRADYLRDIIRVVGTYLGVAGGILVLISEISFLDIEPNEGWGFLDRCAGIEERVRGWECGFDAGGGVSAALVALTYAYRGAALVYLYRRMRSYFLTEKGAVSSQAEAQEVLEVKMGLAVAETLRHLKEIPWTEQVESALLFPLFLAGGEVTRPGEMSVIRRRLEMMFAKRGFQNILQALAMLEEVWDGRLQGSGDGDWEGVGARQG